MRARPGLAKAALTALGLLLAAGLLAYVVSRTDLSASWASLRSAGPLAAVALLPFAFGLSADTLGLVVLLRALGHRVTIAQVLPIRLASEALHVSLPAGFVAAETATALLLEGRCGVPVRDGLVATLARKWLVMRAHGAYIVCGAAAGFATLAGLSRALGLGASLPWLVAASSLVPLGLSAALGAGLLGGSTFARLHRALCRLPSPRLATWLAARRHDASTTDAQGACLRRAAAATALATMSFLGAWCLEAIESVVVLRVVGADVTVAGVFAVEAGLSLVRSAAVVAPSGLGVVDLGYATVLPLLGADPAAATAFVLLKRAKESAWMVAGYALWLAWRARASSSIRAPQVPAVGIAASGA